MKYHKRAVSRMFVHLVSRIIIICEAAKDSLFCFF